MQGNEPLVAILGMVMSFAVPLLLVAVILYYKHRRLRLTHETISRLAERGLPVPPELLDPPRARHFGLRAGLVLMALGVALGAFFVETGGPASIGLIPGLMGLALLVAWTIERRTRP
jgi:hypothetical protein